MIKISKIEVLANLYVNISKAPYLGSTTSPNYFTSDTAKCLVFKLKENIFLNIQTNFSQDRIIFIEGHDGHTYRLVRAHTDIFM